MLDGFVFSSWRNRYQHYQVFSLTHSITLRNGISPNGQMLFLGGGVTGEPLVYPLWFVRDLFFLNIISVFLKHIIDKFPKAILLILLLAWILNFDTKVFFCSIQSLCFWCFGYYIIKFNVHCDRLKYISLCKLLTIYLLLFGLSFLWILYKRGVL